MIASESGESVEGEAYVCACRYDDVLAKQDGVWKFRMRTVTFYYFVPLKDGWGKDRMRFPSATRSPA